MNPAGFNVSNVLIRKTPALFLRGKLEIYKQIWRRRICRRRHLLPGQPVTLTMTFPLRILPENENENTYTEASSDKSSSDPETESNAKSEVRRSSTVPKTKPKPIWTGSRSHPVELIKLLKTIYKKWQPGCFQLFSWKQRSNGHWTRTERRIVTVTTNWIWKLSITKSFCDSFYLIVIHPLFRLLWKLCYALRKKIETKKKQKSGFHCGMDEVSTELSKHRRQPKRE